MKSIHFKRKKRKLPRSKFSPDRTFLEKKVQEFFSNGGKIKILGEDKYNFGRTTSMENIFDKFMG